MVKKIYWKEMLKDITKFVEKCSICLRSGEARINTKNRIIESNGPNELWVCDLIGRIPDQRGNNKFIFIAIDHYSKWVETSILATKDATSAMNAVEELIIKKHGIPKRILSDNGLEFVNTKMKCMAERYGFEWVLNSPEHHQTVGAVERANQSLMSKLKKLTNYGAQSWERALSKATNALNYSFNRAIRTSPYVFKFGKTPEFQIDKELEIPEVIVPRTESKQERDREFAQYAKKSIEKGKIQIKERLNINDPVLIFKKPLSQKFKENWKQGFKIVEFIEPDAYLVTDGKSRYRLNKSHLKLDTSRGEEEMS
jgi:transposase InsO family protein